jgi:hypothetical protein
MFTDSRRTPARGERAIVVGARTASSESAQMTSDSDSGDELVGGNHGSGT